MVKNYFLATNTVNWCVKEAYEELEKEMPLSPMCQLFSLLKQQLRDVLASDSVDHQKGGAALKLLQSWRSIKSKILKKTASSSSLEINNNHGIAIIGSNVDILYDRTDEATSSKRALSEDDNSSVQSSWNSFHKAKKTKFAKIYLSNSYGETDFKGDGQSAHWTVGDIDMTTTFIDFREKSIKGAQMRKGLSDQRILSLSYIFFISNKSKLLSEFTSDEKTSIMKDLQVKKSLKPIEESSVLACHRIHQVLQQDDINENEATDAIDDIRGGCAGSDAKVAARIVSSLLYRFMSWSESISSEANLIIEVLRPFVFECVIKPCNNIQFEWMTYRMSSYEDDCQLMIPDLAVYIDAIANIKLELFLIEVKKQGNCSNGSLEKDLVKLGKEMQLALDKLVVYKVENPVVMGLLIEGVKMTAFRMDLEFDGQYRMLDIGQVFLVRDNINDIMLVPAIMQKLAQVKDGIEETKRSLFKAIKGHGTSNDKKSYMRKRCTSPLLVNTEEK